MTKRIILPSPTVSIAPNSQGIDTIELIVKYSVFIKMVDKLGLNIKALPKGHKLYTKINDEIESDKTKRLKVSKFRPIIEIIRLPKVNPKDKYSQIVIKRNTPLLFDVATKRKTAKDTYCLITFAGLHQPTKKISSEAMKIVSKFLKAKAFKLHRVDFAKDVNDPRPIDQEGLKAFKERFKPYSSSWVLQPKKSKNNYYTSYYINNIDHRSIFTIKYYDKAIKSLQNKENISFKDRHWKRLEVVLMFDVTRPKSLNFMDYINSIDFLEDFSDLEEMAREAELPKYSNDYLEYQITSFLDNRFLKSRFSKKQFNLKEALEFFNKSESRNKYVLPI